jgi:quinol monooxygenase YgiN
MSVKVFVELRIKEEELVKFSPIFSTFLQETRSRDGNEGVTVCANQDSPTDIVLVGQWSSRHHYEQYNQWRTERGDLSRLDGLLREPPTRRIFDYLGV